MTPKRLAHGSGHGNRTRPPEVYGFIANYLSQACAYVQVEREASDHEEVSLGFFQSGVFLDEFLLAVTRKTDGQLDLVAGAFSTQNQAPSILCVAHV